MQNESTSDGVGSAHPGTSGRSPAPPRGAAVGAGVGRPSVGSTSTAAAGGRPSLDHAHHHHQYNPGRPSYGTTGSGVRGTRLSYGTAAHAGGGAAGMSGTTPAHQSGVMSPPSTASTANNHNVQLDFLSPSTAKYLKGRDEGAGATAGAVGAVEAAGGGSMEAPPSSASRAAADAVRNAANAARGVDGNGDEPMDDGNAQQIDGNLHGSEDESSRLRTFVQSLLGMQLPASSPTTNVPNMTTPDPTTAAFYATSLLTKTASKSPDGSHNWRPDDAYLSARALSLKGEHKRAIWMLDKVGLIGFGMGNGGGEGNAGGEAGEGDVGGGVAEIDSRNQSTASYVATPAISNEQGIRNALLLRAESALLAGQCLTQAGEYERALAVYEEAMRFPPPPPPAEWGTYGYGYRLDGANMILNSSAGEEEEQGFDARLADEMYIRSWREQSLSHTALIDDGDDERLAQLASNIRPLPSDVSNADPATTVMEGIHPMARLCAARGMAYDAISNPHRAVPFLRTALAIDARCVEALDYVIDHRLLTPEEEREWVCGLNFGEGTLGEAGLSWLRDSYLARLRGSGGLGVLSPGPSALQEGPEESKIMGASPVPRGDLQSPSMLSLGSPDFAGGAAGRDRTAAVAEDPFAEEGAIPSTSRTVDEAFSKLAVSHNLGRSPDVLSRAAIRSYALHDLRSALAYCTAIDSIDPYCRTAGYVHVATLVGLDLKRRLFQLAHRLVDTDPKDALAWFAVGSYYYACKRYDLAQRHFSRSTRLDPGCAECWIGFGCSFAVCDESDQALASFRAAQNKYAGSHVPLLYMGMEYLRTNHLSLAGHFLNSAQKTDPNDMLTANELGVWAYRQGDMEDAAFWFVRALRLGARRAECSSLTSVDEGLGMGGYVLLTGKQGDGMRKRGGVEKKQGGTMAMPHAKRQPGEEPPLSTVLCAAKTPSGQSIAASTFDGEVADVDEGVELTDTECVERCKDRFWEPTIFNLGQSYRKMKRYADAVVCFEKCCSLNPGNYAAYAALGFARHLGGDVDGAIDSYHEALSRKPEDPFASEMLSRALSEAVTYPPSLAMLSSHSHGEGGALERGGIGSSILKKMGHGNDYTSSSYDVDMSLAA